MLGTMALGFAAPSAHAATPIPFTGSYSQNFDTLPLTGNVPATAPGPFDVPTEGGGTLPGWQYQGTKGNPRFIASDGSSNTGAVYSFGTTGASDRALGALASGSFIGRSGAIFRNDSTTTYSNFTISYNGEVWRSGGTGNANNVSFNYTLTDTLPADISGAGTGVPALNFTKTTTGSAGAVDGNAAANRAAISGSVPNISWAPGTYLVIRFDDVDDPGADDGLGVDDVALTASDTAVQTNPVASNPLAAPNTLEQGQQTLLSVKVTAGANPVSTGIAVVANLTAIGGSATQQFFDDGTNGDSSPNDGTFSYLATVGANTTPGATNIAVRVADAQNRTDNTFIALTVNPKTFPSTTLVISEFRTRGAGGAGDEFIEIHNLSNVNQVISGFKILYSSSTGSSPSQNGVVPANTYIPPGGYFLFAPTSGPLSATSNANVGGLADNGGFALATANGTIIDQVGLSTGTQLKEGTPLPAFPSDNDAANRSYERLAIGVNNTDTNNNSADFALTGANGNTGSNPQGLPVGNSAPRLNNATYSTSANVSYTQQLGASDADGDTLSYALASGALPPGLSLGGATGLLSGTPTQSGRFDFSVSVTDGRGGIVTAKFIIIVSAASDGIGPLITRSGVPTPVTRDALASSTLTGTIRDVAPNGVTPTGVRLMLFQIRRNSDGFSYSGPTDGFTSNTNRGYYPGTLGASSDGTTGGTRNFSRSLSWLPDATILVAGDYTFNVIGQDNAGNWSVEVVPLTIIAPNAADAPTPPNTQSAKFG